MKRNGSEVERGRSARTSTVFVNAEIDASLVSVDVFARGPAVACRLALLKGDQLYEVKG